MMDKIVVFTADLEAIRVVLEKEKKFKNQKFIFYAF